MCFQLWILQIWSWWTTHLIYCIPKSSLVQCICTWMPAAGRSEVKYTQVLTSCGHVMLEVTDRQRWRRHCTKREKDWCDCNEEPSNAFVSGVWNTFCSEEKWDQSPSLSWHIIYLYFHQEEFMKSPQMEQLGLFSYSHELYSSLADGKHMLHHWGSGHERRSLKTWQWHSLAWETAHPHRLISWPSQLTSCFNLGHGRHSAGHRNCLIERRGTGIVGLYITVGQFWWSASQGESKVCKHKNTVFQHSQIQKLLCHFALSSLFSVHLHLYTLQDSPMLPLRWG